MSRADFALKVWMGGRMQSRRPVSTISRRDEAEVEVGRAAAAERLDVVGCAISGVQGMSLENSEREYAYSHSTHGSWDRYLA